MTIDDFVRSESQSDHETLDETLDETLAVLALDLLIYQYPCGHSLEGPGEYM